MKNKLIMVLFLTLTILASCGDHSQSGGESTVSQDPLGGAGGAAVDYYYASPSCWWALRCNMRMKRNYRGYYYCPGRYVNVRVCSGGAGGGGPVRAQ